MNNMPCEEFSMHQYHAGRAVQETLAEEICLSWWKHRDAAHESCLFKNHDPIRTLVQGMRTASKASLHLAHLTYMQ